MKYNRIKKIKNNYECFWCWDEGFYWEPYMQKNIYCIDCQNKKSWIGKIIEKVFYS